jgi:LAO/AO transport system kinase
MINDLEALLEKFRAGNIRALGRAISLVENRDEASKDLLEKVHHLTGKAQIIGFTGSPGAGKSSLIDSLVSHIRKNNLKAGIIAVDPSSPFTGGAILGDRIRMIQHSTDKGVFIRSMANRGQSGGLGVATKETIKLLDAFGFDVIIVETVGTGQTEVDIVKTADTVVVVLNPEAGDEIQAIKAGIMEIADIFVINKADLPGAGKARLSIETAVHESKPRNTWPVPVLLVSAVKEQGMPELWEKIREHWDFLNKAAELEKRRLQQLQEEIVSMLEYKIKHYLELKLKEEEFINIIRQANKKEITSRDAVEEIFKRL